MGRDVEFLISILQYQERIMKIVDKEEKTDCDYDLLRYYILSIHKLTKRITNKTVTRYSTLNKFIWSLIVEDMGSCIPKLSNTEVEDYALALADQAAQSEIERAYTDCVTKSSGE